MNEKASDWNIDPKSLLEDPHVNPQLREAVRTALEKAKADGLFPRVGEVYRTPERSQQLHDTLKGPAAEAWHSAHNYGIGVDIYLYDANHQRIDYDNRAMHPDWYKQVKDFADKYMDKFAWGVKNDSDHFEYHPDFSKPLSGRELENLRDQVLKEVGGKTKEDYYSWIEHMWEKVGAGNQVPEVKKSSDGGHDVNPPDAGEKQTPPEALQSIQSPEVNQSVAPPEVNQSIQPPEVNQSIQSPDTLQRIQPRSDGGAIPVPPTLPDDGYDTTIHDGNAFRRDDDATNSNVGNVEVYPKIEKPLDALKPAPKEGPVPWPEPLRPISPTDPDTTPPTPIPPGFELPPEFTPDNPYGPLPGQPAEPTPPSDGRTLDQLLGPPDLPMTPQEINDLLNAAPGERSDAEVQAEKQQGMDALMKEIGAGEPKQSIQFPDALQGRLADGNLNNTPDVENTSNTTNRGDMSDAKGYGGDSSDTVGYDGGYFDTNGYDGGHPDAGGTSLATEGHPSDA